MSIDAILDATFYNNVQTALRTALKSVPGCPDDAHCVNENRIYTSTAKEPWLRWTFRPQPNKAASLGTSQILVRHPGTLIIDYYVPANTGTEALDTFTAAVLTVMRPGARFSSNGQLVLVRMCFASGGMPSDQFFFRSITLGWLADTRTVT